MTIIDEQIKSMRQRIEYNKDLIKGYTSSITSLESDIKECADFLERIKEMKQ